MNSCAICMEDGCTLPRTIDAHVDAGKILKDFPEYQNRRLVTRIATLEAQLAEAVAALEFYAEPFTWSRVMANARHVGAIENYDFNGEFGAIAREALAKLSSFTAEELKDLKDGEKCL